MSQNFNIIPGMSSWHDMPKKYKEAYFKKNMNTFRIIIAAAYQVFIEQAQAIKYSLKELGAQTVIIQDDAVVNWKEHYDVNIIFKALKKWHPRSRSVNVLFQTEELWNRRERGYYDLGENYNRVLEMYDENVKIPKGTRNVVYCPVGYSPAWERDLPIVPEDIDILFHGSITQRRGRFIDEFRKMGLNVVATQTSFGKDRDKLIARAKIDINIKAYDNWSYGPMHCLPAQANKKFMLAEKANGGYGPFKPGLHVAEYDGLVDCRDKVKYWLDHEKERKEFAINAYNDMVKTCNFTDILAKAMAGLI